MLPLVLDLGLTLPVNETTLLTNETTLPVHETTLPTNEMSRPVNDVFHWTKENIPPSEFFLRMARGDTAVLLHCCGIPPSGNSFDYFSVRYQRQCFS